MAELGAIDTTVDQNSGRHVYARAMVGSDLKTEHAHAKPNQRHRSRKHAFSHW